MIEVKGVRTSQDWPAYNAAQTSEGRHFYELAYALCQGIKMPDKSGYDVFAAARRHSASLPVILMTGFGYDPNHSIVRASQEGLQAVLFKPFKVNQLLAEIRKALQPRVAQ